jgi:hypothetical protein
LTQSSKSTTNEHHHETNKGSHGGAGPSVRVELLRDEYTPHVQIAL